MTIKSITFAIALALAMFLAAAARSGNKDALKTVGAAAGNDSHSDTIRLEGEKRFRSNCSRCHAAPPKFPPRMMDTIVRHMRVRANITEDDRRLILRYMTE